MEKIVYSFDPETGIFAGTCTADESPMEPGVFLIPAHATELPVPAVAAGQEAIFGAGAWAVQAIPAPPPPPVKTAAQLWAEYQSRAQAALDKSDITILRCVENAVAVPAEWATYRKDLRSIIAALSGDASQALPAMPAYPAGT